MSAKRLDLGIAVLLASVTAAAFSPSLRASFVDLDDFFYVVDNPHVNTGLFGENIAWAFTAFHSANWHPLTWLSLQLDATIAKAIAGELDPRGFHAVNVLLHAANAVVLYYTLRDLTGSRWRTAVVAALFALHPLRVESVAWVSERKDVLSVLFGLLALRIYPGYARHHTRLRMAGVAGCLALSLLAKPMLVTLPCLLLVMDWWPLGRAAGLTPWRRLLTEKLALFALALVSCIVTFAAQRSSGTVTDLDTLPIGDRIATALVAYTAYLRVTILPWGLAPYYRYPANAWPAALVAVSVLVLVAITAVALGQRRKRPYLLAGWLWYVGTLVPVIGLVQVGHQAYADRYTYFPSIGLYVATVWVVADWLVATQPGKQVAVVLTAVLLGACGVLTWRQCQFWTSDLALWQHALEVTGPDALIYNSVGAALERKEKSFKEAAEYYRLAVATDPQFGPGHCNLGRVLLASRQPDAAIARFESALSAKVRSEGANVAAHRNLGFLLDHAGRSDEALFHLAEAVRLNPDDALAQQELGVRQYRRNELAAALEHFNQAAVLKPDSALGWNNLGIVLQRLGRNADALACFRRCVELDPSDVHGRLRLATAFAAAGDVKTADAQYREAWRVDGRWPEVLIREAWKLSTAADERERDGEAAVWSAETACGAVRPPPAEFLDVLAASYAEARRFAEATAAAEKAIAAVENGQKAELAREMAGRLELYRRSLPFHKAVAPQPATPAPRAAEGPQVDSPTNVPGRVRPRSTDASPAIPKSK
jgi:Flp pilus assembly protein TadD